MLLRKRAMFVFRRLLQYHFKPNIRSASHLCTENPWLHQYLNIDKDKAEYIALKNPSVRKLSSEDIENLILKVNSLGYRTNVLIDYPVLFSVLPISLDYRHKVLKECGFIDVLPEHLAAYLNIVKRKKVKYLRNSGLLPVVMNVENKLASYMSQWPTSLTTLIQGDSEEKSLCELRLKIIQRYLELLLDVNEEDFNRGVTTYPTIKHRPLSVINETLNLLQSDIMIPNNKIKSNFYLIHADPDNLKHILYKFKSIGGIDIKEILRLHPKIAMKNHKTLIEIRKVLQDFNISNEAQCRCFEIYTLSPDTIRERLEKSKSIPEFNALYNHPRFLKMIFYNNTALARLRKSYNQNKRCLSLHILSGASTRYSIFEQSPGDRSGKGKDLVFLLTQKFGGSYSASNIRNIIKRHPFWINVPVVQVNYVYNKLSTNFSKQDIYENCHILLYPWNKVNNILKKLKATKNGEQPLIDNAQLKELKKKQILSLALYYLERNHYFSGNGVWSEDQIKNVVDLSAQKAILLN